MGAPQPGMDAVDQPAAESLLDAFKTISAAERRKHASVLNYWLSIRGDKEFPPLHDLDPLEISDAGPTSILLELISGGHDAEVRHLGEALRFEGQVDRIIDAASPSLLACIAKKLPIVAISRDFLAFEDDYSGEYGKTKCWVTLLPLSAGGAWVDYVYALVSYDAEEAKAGKKKAEAPAKKGKDKDPEPDAAADATVAEEAEVPVSAEVPEEAEEPVVAEAPEEAPVETEPEQAVTETEPEEAATEAETEEAVAATEPEAAIIEPEPEEAVVEPEIEEPVAEVTDQPGAELDPIPEFLQAAPDADEAPSKSRPGFSKLFDNLVGLTGFYGHGYKVDPESPDAPSDEPVAYEPIAEAADTEEPLVDGPVAEEPVAEESVAEEPVADAEPQSVELGSEEAPAQPLGDELVEFADASDKSDGVEPEPETVVEEPGAAEEPGELVIAEQPIIERAEASAPPPEGSLENKLSDVRAKADEARQAKLRANAALYEGLSAAYDFALDAEDAPEEYLKLVEAQGLKIQLRSPMKPVVKLAFAGMCDDSTIKQLEAILAWALDNELPRGSLLDQIEAAGGIGPILNGEAKAA